ncbi:MAG: hypothetical protein ACRC76_05080 [Proteocatella sp.]
MKLKKIIIPVAVLVMLILATSVFMTNKNRNITLNHALEGNDVKLEIYGGENYLHDFSVNSLIKIKTPPQMAVWIEDLEGNYIDTIYVTEKTMYKKWSKASGDEEQIDRKESLPYWTHKKESKEMVADQISAATPKGDSTIVTKLSALPTEYRVLAEVNMSTDFNEYYPKEALESDDNYSGGPFGSGQPAIVYEALVNSEEAKSYELSILGCSSADGSSGDLVADTSKLTTALEIIDKITFALTDQ